MLSTPARNARATAAPVSRSGTARTRVADVNAYQDPNEPLQSAASPRPTGYPPMRSRSAVAPVMAAIRMTAIASSCRIVRAPIGFGGADRSVVGMDAEHQPSDRLTVHRGLANQTSEDDQHTIREQQYFVD